MTSPPAPNVSRVELTVRFVETDMMGIVHHSNYFHYFEMGRVDYLKKRGLDYALWSARGLQMPLASASIRYRRPARFDDVLVLETRCVEVKRATASFAYRLTKGDELLTEAETLMACVGMSLAPCRMPDDIAARLVGPEGGAPGP